MTAGRPLKTSPTEDQPRPEPLPDPPRSHDMQQQKHITRADQTLETWFHGRRERVLVNGQGYLCRERREARTSPHPDCVVAFDVDAEGITETNGYVINEVGKPPEFVMEVASETTGERDYEVKREQYAALGVGEYWRFDHTGGNYHDVALAGDRLVDGSYAAISDNPGTGRGDLGLQPHAGAVPVLGKAGTALLRPSRRDIPASATELKAQRDAAEARATPPSAPPKRNGSGNNCAVSSPNP